MKNPTNFRIGKPVQVGEMAKFILKNLEKKKTMTTRTETQITILYEFEDRHKAAEAVAIHKTNKFRVAESQLATKFEKGYYILKRRKVLEN